MDIREALLIGEIDRLREAGYYFRVALGQDGAVRPLESGHKRFKVALSNLLKKGVLAVGEIHDLGELGHFVDNKVPNIF